MPHPLHTLTELPSLPAVPAAASPRLARLRSALVPRSAGQRGSSGSDSASVPHDLSHSAPHHGVEGHDLQQRQQEEVLQAQQAVEDPAAEEYTMQVGGWVGGGQGWCFGQTMRLSLMGFVCQPTPFRRGASLCVCACVGGLILGVVPLRLVVASERDASFPASCRQWRRRPPLTALGRTMLWCLR